MKLTIDAETKQFQKWIGEYAEALPRDVQPTALRALALEFVGRVIVHTPVDTGRARSGWLAYAEHSGKQFDAGGSGTPKAKAARVQGKSEGSFGEDFRGKDQYVEVINGVPYIVQLEFGSSEQGNRMGMVRVAFREMQGKADDIFLKELEKANKKATAKSRGIRG